jgi:hypothetical protein
VPPETPEARIQQLTSSLTGRGGAALERFYDSGLVLPESTDRREITDYEVERIGRAFAIVALINSIPRRLGHEASRDELALDKRRARRVGHALIQASRGWRTTEPKIRNDEDVRIAAIHLNWEAFGPAHTTTVHNRMRFVATYAFKADDLRWGKSALSRLENEISWVSYALRD